MPDTEIVGPSPLTGAQPQPCLGSGSPPVQFRSRPAGALVAPSRQRGCACRGRCGGVRSSPSPGNGGCGGRRRRSGGRALRWASSAEQQRPSQQAQPQCRSQKEGKKEKGQNPGQQQDPWSETPGKGKNGPSALHRDSPGASDDGGQGGHSISPWAQNKAELIPPPHSPPNGMG
ncbi:centrin-3 isoform X2 [Prinia subflava]|uniref:centrin-3 isoform X2 n=1 Tax=Prinia subflava TaxID=208062 RepID=UPI002FE027E1